MPSPLSKILFSASDYEEAEQHTNRSRTFDFAAHVKPRESSPSSSPARATASGVLASTTAASVAVESGARATANAHATAAEDDKDSHMSSSASSSDYSDNTLAVHTPVPRSTTTASAVGERSAQAITNAPAAATEHDTDESSDTSSASSEYGDYIPESHAPISRAVAGPVPLPTWTVFSSSQVRLLNPVLRSVRYKNSRSVKDEHPQIAVIVPCGHRILWKGCLNYWRGCGWGFKSNDCPFCGRTLFRFQIDELEDPLGVENEAEKPVVASAPIFVDGDDHNNGVDDADNEHDDNNDDDEDHDDDDEEHEETDEDSEEENTEDVEMSESGADWKFHNLALPINADQEIRYAVARGMRLFEAERESLPRRTTGYCYRISDAVKMALRALNGELLTRSELFDRLAQACVGSLCSSSLVLTDEEQTGVVRWAIQLVNAIARQAVG